MPPSVNEPLINSTAKQLRLIAKRVPEIAADRSPANGGSVGRQGNERMASQATPEHYRQEADRLRKRASTTANEIIRRQLLAIARGYEDLATTVELIARQRP